MFLDLSAAFDTIDHLTVLDRLRDKFGIDGVVLEWFRSYLADRSQQVIIGSDRSRPMNVHYGVPQGSCLGPLLFSIYTSQIFDIVSDHLPNVHCFADDTQLYLSAHLNIVWNLRYTNDYLFIIIIIIIFAPTIKPPKMRQLQVWKPVYEMSDCGCCKIS